MTTKVRRTIVIMRMMKTKLGELEFGRELDFFESNGAKEVHGPKPEFRATYYELSIGDNVVTLIEHTDTQVPALIRLVRRDLVRTTVQSRSVHSSQGCEGPANQLSKGAASKGRKHQMSAHQTLFLRVVLRKHSVRIHKSSRIPFQAVFVM